MRCASGGLEGDGGLAPSRIRQDRMRGSWSRLDYLVIAIMRIWARRALVFEVLGAHRALRPRLLGIFWVADRDLTIGDHTLW